MMIDELRERKRELLDKKKYELELQSKGEGSELNLFMINEELLDVNNHLKALTGGRPKSFKAVDTSDFTKNRQQYLNWRCEDTAFDDEIEDERTLMRRTAAAGLDLLSPRQKEMMQMYLSGKNTVSIAKELGIHKSSASRTIARAKKALKDETERAKTANRLLAEDSVVDLRNPAAAKVILMTMTPKQAVYFYLRYSERLTIREIRMLNGVDRPAVYRIIRWALQNIDELFGGREVVLEYPEALDELAYQTYCHLKDHPETLSNSTSHQRALHHNIDPPPMCDIHVQIRKEQRGNKKTPPGKLLSALRDRQETEDDRDIFRWLDAVFAALLVGLRGTDQRVPKKLHTEV